MLFIEMDLVTTILMGLNALVPLLFSGFLFILYKKHSKIYYQYWSIGFFFFSISNIFIAFHDILDASVPLLNGASIVTSMLSFSSIIIGIGYFVQKPRVFFLLASIVPIMTFVLIVLGYSTTIVENLTALTYLLLTFFIYWMRIKFELSLEIVDMGWVIILVANVGYVLGQMTLQMTYIFSILGKIIVFLWMSRPHFNAFTEEIENFLLSGGTSSRDISRGISIVESSSQKEDDLKWMLQRLKNKAHPDIRKILILTPEQFNSEDLMKSGLLDIPNVYLVNISQAFHSQKPVFSEKIVTISNDLNILNAMLGEIISFVDNKSIRTCIMIDNLSTLIHIHGWRSVYSFLISNIPKLKQGNIATYFLFSPSTHENKHEVMQLRQLGDNIIKIIPD